MVAERRISGLVLSCFVTFAIITAGQDIEQTFANGNHESTYHKVSDHEKQDRIKDASPVVTVNASSNKVRTAFIGIPSKRVKIPQKKNESPISTAATMNHTTKPPVVEAVTPPAKYRPMPKPEIKQSAAHNITETTGKPIRRRFMLTRYKNMKDHLSQRMHHSVKLYNAHHHLRRRGHLYFFNQFVYELKTLRSCFYQFVKKGCTLSVFYQSLDTEPLTVCISDEHNMVLHDNYLRKSGNFSLTAKENNIYGICLENYSWDVKKVFLSIRVESHRNSKVLMMPHHPMALSVLGHIRNLEVEVRSMQAQLWDRKARGSSNKIAENEKIEFAIWITWLVVLSTLLIYVLQVMEIHRVVRSAELRYCGRAEYVRIALRDPNVIDY